MSEYISVDVVILGLEAEIIWINTYDDEGSDRAVLLQSSIDAHRQTIAELNTLREGLQNHGEESAEIQKTIDRMKAKG